MSLSSREVAKLNRIKNLAQQLLTNGATNGKTPRIRRTGRELVQFRKMLKAERRSGVPVAVLARKHGISSAYIYTLP